MNQYVQNRILAQNLRNKLRRKRRHLRMATDYYDLANERFLELFRFSKDDCKELVEEVKPFMQEGKYNSRISKELRFLIALRFFAQGSYQRSVGQDFLINVSQTIVSRCVREVCNIFNTHLLTRYVRFPRTIEEMQAVKMQFYEKHGFPGVIGAIDGTHIKIRKPHRDVEHVYVCRKGGHSINVQIVCDQNLRIIDCNSKFGGTAHDASVWRASALRVFLMNKYDSGDRNWWLLGDSGYPLLPYLMTPILGCNLSPGENRYNVQHKKARNCVERCFGVLKSRFRCLSAERVLCYDPATAGKIINTCIVMHNIFIEKNTAMLPTEEVDIEMLEELNRSNDISDENPENTPEGVLVRQKIINDYFIS